MSLFGPPDVEKMKARGDVSGLIKALGYQKDDEIRIAAAKALGVLKDPRAVEPLMVVLKIPSKWDPKKPAKWQTAAGEALAEIGAPAKEPLLAALKTNRYNYEERIVVRLAAAALGKMSVRLNDTALCIRAAEVLGEKSSASSEYRSDFDWQDQAAREEALKGMGAPAVQLLTTALKNPDIPRKTVVRVLGNFGDPCAVQPLIEALKDRDSGVREEAVGGLARLGQPAVEPLLALLGADTDVRRASAKALLGIMRGYSSRTEVFKPIWARRTAVRNAYSGDDDYLLLPLESDVETLASYLNDENLDKRRQAAEALVTLYKQGDLSEKAKKTVLAKRDWIEQKHYDDLSSCGTHTDQGVGVYFPL